MKILPLLLLLAFAERSAAFCGFYVARADAKLFNKASQVVLARHGQTTTITMVNDYKGDPAEFATVIPVPTAITREQIRVVERAVIDHLDAYTAPRLVEYRDEDPCMRNVWLETASSFDGGGGAQAKGVTVEAAYTVGEYDILVLSATQSDGLESWLRENGYNIPAGASGVLGSYIKQKVKFFVAKVNLEAQAQTGFSYLRPLQVRFESPKFMLPIRLGTVNADGPQELLIYALAQSGRIEALNYRTVKLPTGLDIPLFVKEEFGEFYKALFYEQVRQNDMKAVLLEYAWDMNWCDPCAADPLSVEELRELGATWVGAARATDPVKGQARDAYVTRLHLQYTAETFPEDLIFQETGNRENFQARYILRHPWVGRAQCAEAQDYLEAQVVQTEEEVRNLASMTGWDADTEIRPKIEQGLSVLRQRPGLIRDPGEVVSVHRLDGVRLDKGIKPDLVLPAAPDLKPGLYLIRYRDGRSARLLVKPAER